MALWFDPQEPPRRAWRNRDGQTVLDIALSKLGFGQGDDEVYQRPEEPSGDCVVLSSSLVSATNDVSAEPSDFPFLSSQALRMRAVERLTWQRDRVGRLLSIYEGQLAQLRSLSDANGAADAAAPQSARRAQGYFAFFSGLVEAPDETFRVSVSRLVGLQKLWGGRAGGRGGTYCVAPSCPHVAIRGSTFCGWHILRDARQRLFVRCEECGLPRPANRALECQGHRRQKSLQARRAGTARSGAANPSRRAPGAQPRTASSRVRRSRSTGK